MILEEFIESQEILDEDFEVVLFDNLWDLLQSE